MNYLATGMPALYPFSAYCLPNEDYLPKKVMTGAGVSEASESQIHQRNQIIKWLKEMDEEERMRMLVIQTSGGDTEPNHVEILLRLYWNTCKGEKDPMLVMLKKDYFLDHLTKHVHDKKFMDFFDFRKLTKTHRVSHFHEKLKPERVAAEAKLLQSFRVCSVEEFGDSIFIDRELAKQPDKLIELFDTISQSKMFLDFPELRYAPLPLLQPKQQESKKADPWFDIYNSNTIAAVFLGFLEHWIILRYCFFTRYIRAQKKDSLPHVDMVLPWKNCKELPGLLREFPEVLHQGVSLAETEFKEHKLWYEEEEEGKTPKNAPRNRLLFRMAMISCPYGFFGKYRDSDVQLQEILHLLKTESKERLIESMLCPTIEQFGTGTNFILQAIGQHWIHLVANLKILKFQECESKKGKKKKRKAKRKRPVGEETKESNPLESPNNEQEDNEMQTSFREDSLLLSAPNGKTIADEDTRCANLSSKSLEKPELKKDVFSVENAIPDKSGENFAAQLRPEISAPQSKNLIKKKLAALRKEECKREKRKLKRKQQKEAAKLKKLMGNNESESSSLGSCCPLEKASCLSVAGSGVILNFENQIVREPICSNSGNLILKQKQRFFEDDEEPQTRNRGVSLCTIEFEAIEQRGQKGRSFSFDSRSKQGQMTQYGLMSKAVQEELQSAKRKSTFANTKAILSTKPKVTSGEGKKQSQYQTSNKKETKQQKKTEVQSSKNLKPKDFGITKCVYEERERMTHANYSTTAADLRSGFKRVSKQAQNSGSYSDVYESGSGYKRRVSHSTTTEKIGYGSKARLEKKLQERVDNYSFSGTATSQEYEMLNYQAPLNQQRSGDHLLLNESLNLPQFIEGSSLGLDMYPRSIEEDYYGRSYSMPGTFLSPVREEEKSVTFVVPDCILQDATIKFLEQEIHKFVQHMNNYSENLNEVRKVCKERIEMVAKVSFMGADDLSVKTYGSWDTGLSIPGSDIDLMISTPGVDKDLSVKMLETLEDNLSDFEWTSGIRNILSAQIPVLKLQVDTKVEFTREYFPPGVVSDEFLEATNRLVKAERKEGDSYRLSVDIIIETPEISALQTTQYVVESCNRWPELRGLVLMLKYFLSKRGLTNPYTGGLSSYAISLLVESWLIRSKQLKDYRGSLYLMFRDLIEFYAIHFNTFCQSIWLNVPPFMRTSSYPFCDFGPPDGILFISDPCCLVEAKNVTFNAFSFPTIQLELKILLETLLSNEVKPPELVSSPSSQNSAGFFRDLFDHYAKLEETE